MALVRRAARRRRAVVAGACALFVAAGCWALVRAVDAAPVTEMLSALGDRILEPPLVRVTGSESVSRRELLRGVPAGRSALWWHTHRDEVERIVRAHPAVASAAVERCAEGGLRCFEITLQERKPRYLLSVRGAQWELGADGVFIRELRGESPLDGTVRISGFERTNDRPEAISAAVRIIEERLGVLERETGAAAHEVAVVSADELDVIFSGLPFTARFAVDRQHPSFGEQVRRLAVFLEEFAGRFATVEHVDFAFERLAVVRFRTGAAAKR